MRPLNRPMFKYGGPIKEGIMDGMREPKKDGKIVGGKQSPLLAGAHPLKDAEGREHHFLPALYAGGLAALNAARIAGPALVRGFKAARAFGATPGKLGFFGRAKDLGTIRPGISLPMASRPESAAFRVGSFIKQNPILSASIPSLSYDAARIGGPLAGETLKGVANFLVPGTALDPFKPKQPEVPQGDGTGLQRGDGKTKNVGDITGTTKPGEAGGTTVKSDAEKQQINEDRINETKQKYYKLMGIDKMNKDAVYDSLIDASKIVSEEGADLKGSIRSGNLQNRIIQAISQNLDKSADLKKQIDAAVLKGEIEKDIKASDPSAAVDLAYKKAATDKIKKDLEGTSAADVLATAEIQGKNLVTSNTLTSILASKGTSVDFTFPDDKYQKWEKNNKNKDEIDYLQENYGGLDDGLYVVNKKAVQVKDGSATFVDLDTITG